MSDDAIEITRFLPATPAEVLTAFVQPDEIRKWWGPRGCETSECEIDLRAGGRCRWVMAFDGMVRTLFGEIVEFEPDRLLVMKNMWDDPANHATLITIRVTPRGSGTELHIRHEQFPDGSDPQGFKKGWESSLERLEEMFGGGKE